MTVQIPGTCFFDGRKYAIEAWKGNAECIPSNESLNIETSSPHTANWSGRIDHFMIHQDRLYLFKIEVKLLKPYLDSSTQEIRREVLLRYEPMLVTDSKGTRIESREYRFEFLIFDNLTIPYTGELHLSYPYGDLWEQPLTSEEYNEEIEQVVLRFEDGLLTNVS
jgi:hypothetical protein